MTIVYRPATPHDVESAVPLLYSSAPQIYDFVYGREATGYLHHEFVSGWGRVGWRRCLVAEDEGEVVAIIARLDWLSYKVSEFASATGILRFYGLRRGAGILARGLGMRRLIPDVPFRSFFPQNLGVRPDRRNQGIGEHLLAHVVEEARRAGYLWLTFDVMADNRAWRLYQRMGFTDIEKECSIPGSGLSPSYRVRVSLKARSTS